MRMKLRGRRIKGTSKKKSTWTSWTCHEVLFIERERERVKNRNESQKVNNSKSNREWDREKNIPSLVTTNRQHHQVLSQIQRENQQKQQPQMTRRFKAKAFFWIQRQRRRRRWQDLNWLSVPSSSSLTSFHPTPFLSFLFFPWNAFFLVPKTSHSREQNNDYHRERKERLDSWLPQMIHFMLDSSHISFLPSPELHEFPQDSWFRDEEE